MALSAGQDGAVFLKSSSVLTHRGWSLGMSHFSEGQQQGTLYLMIIIQRPGLHHPITHGPETSPVHTPHLSGRQRKAESS